MSVLQPVYRLTIYQQRDGTEENTPLTPVAGAPHSDPFIVSTKTGISGAQPYLGLPQGKRGTFQIPSFKLEVGQYKFPLYDIRTNGTGSNLNRFITAFLGDDSGSVRLNGRKAYVEESLDGGSTFKPFFVGRVNTLEMTDDLTYAVEIRDSIEDLKTPIFTVAPRVEYSVFNALVPFGLTTDLKGFGNEGTSITGVPTLDATVGIDILNFGFDHTRFDVNPESVNNPLNNVDRIKPTQPIYRGSIFINNGPTILTAPSASGIRCQVAGVGDYLVSEFDFSYLNSTQNRAALTAFSLYTPVIPPEFLIGNEVQFKFYQSELSDKAPVWLSRVNPLDVAKDILEGRYFLESSNGQTITIPYDSQSIVDTRTQVEVDKVTYKIDTATTAIDFIEDHICKPFQIGITVEPTASAGIPYSAIRFFSTKMPTTATLGSAVTLTNDDVITGDTVGWTLGTTIRQLEGTYYLESPKVVDTQRSDTTPASTENTVTDTYDFKVFLYDNNDTEANSGKFTVDFNGLRSVASVSQEGLTVTPESTEIEATLRAKTAQLLNLFRTRFGGGTTSVSIPCRRNNKVEGLKSGDFVLVEVDVLPNPATHTRGGTRVMQIVGKHPQGVFTLLDLVDVGINSAMTSPTLGTVLSTGTNRISVPVTSSVDSIINLQVATVPFGATEPNSGDTRWTTRVLAPLSGSYLYQVDDVQAGYSHYIRGRAESPTSTTVRLPSPWVTINSRFDQTTITPMTGLTVTDITRQSAKVSWTNADTGSIQIFLASPTSSVLSDFSLVAEVPEFSTYYPLTGLNLNTSPSHSIAVRYHGTMGGYSPFVSSSFIATGTGAVLPALDGLIVYVGV